MSAYHGQVHTTPDPATRVKLRFSAWSLVARAVLAWTAFVIGMPAAIAMGHGVWWITTAPSTIGGLAFGSVIMSSLKAIRDNNRLRVTFYIHTGRQP